MGLVKQAPHRPWPCCSDISRVITNAHSTWDDITGHHFLMDSRLIMDHCLRNEDEEKTASILTPQSQQVWAGAGRHPGPGRFQGARSCHLEYTIVPLSENSEVKSSVPSQVIGLRNLGNGSGA